MADPMADLSNQMKQMRESGALLQLSPEAISRCLTQVKAFHRILLDQNTRIATLSDMPGNPGQYPEGDRTKQNLIDDTNAIKKLVDDYLNYLNEFSDAVTNTVGSIQKNA